MTGTSTSILTRPLGDHFAEWDGRRSVRMMLGRTTLGLATTAYSYSLTNEEVREAARRIALLWNLSLGVSTEELERRDRETVISVELIGLEGDEP